MKSFGSSKEFNFGKDIQWDEVGEGVRRQIMAYDDSIMLVNVEFKKGHCNVCDSTCDFSIIENRLKTEKELFFTDNETPEANGQSTCESCKK